MKFPEEIRRLKVDEFKKILKESIEGVSDARLDVTSARLDKAQKAFESGTSKNAMQDYWNSFPLRVRAEILKRVKRK